MPTPDRRDITIAAALDTASVLVFVAIGLRNHDDGSAIGDVVATAAPFLIGLATGWLAVRAWNRPLGLLTGIAIWPVTVLVGMVVRRWVFDRGTATSFVIVATIFLGTCLVGWRAARRQMRRPH